jgi:hypothetical protein
VRGRISELVVTVGAMSDTSGTREGFAMSSSAFETARPSAAQTARVKASSAY